MRVQERLTPCGVTFGHADGVVWPLTPCCKSTAKEAMYGVVCRQCFALVGEYYLTSAEIDTEDAVDMILAGVGNTACENPDACARVTARFIRTVENFILDPNRTVSNA